MQKWEDHAKDKYPQPLFTYNGKKLYMTFKIHFEYRSGRINCARKSGYFIFWRFIEASTRICCGTRNLFVQWQNQTERLEEQEEPDRAFNLKGDGRSGLNGLLPWSKDMRAKAPTSFCLTLNRWHHLEVPPNKVELPNDPHGNLTWTKISLWDPFESSNLLQGTIRNFVNSRGIKWK